MSVKLIVAAIALISITTFTAAAQHRGLYNENQRIRQGVKSGELTRLETARLAHQKNELKREAIRFKTNDGRLSRAERAHLKRDHRKLNRNIRHQKHDRQRRY